MDNGMLSNLQASKTIEYLLAIGFLAAFVPFWRFTAARAKAPALARVPERDPAPVRAVRSQAAGWFHLPDGFGLHPGHAWVKAEDGGNVRIGVDDFTRAMIGRVQDAELPAVGTMLRQGEPAVTLSGAEGAVPIVSPVDGMVVETNPAARVGAIEADPYQAGWLLRVHAPRFRSNARQLLSGSAARAFLEDVSRRLREMLSPEIGPALADGGVPVSGIAAEVGPEAWRRIRSEMFLADDEASVRSSAGGGSWKA
jgi:glycine cleavage system H protein